MSYKQEKSETSLISWNKLMLTVGSISPSLPTPHAQGPWPQLQDLHKYTGKDKLNLNTLQDCSVQFSSVQSLSRVRLFATP